MIVVAIIGILAAIAIPRYQDYVTRTQVAEGLNLAGPAKIAIAEYIQTGGTTLSNENVGYPAVNESRYVDSIVVGGTASAPTITINYENPPSANLGVPVLLTGVPSGAVLDWRCTASGASSTAALPSECR